MEGEAGLSDVDRGRREHRDVPRNEHGQQPSRAHRDAEAVLQVLPVAATGSRRRLQELRRDAREQHGREQEGRRVDPVGSVHAYTGGQRAARERAERPGDVVRELDERVRGGQVGVGHRVRDRRVDRRAEDTRGHADYAGHRDDLGRVRRERQGCEGAEADEVGADHQRAAREPVDQRAREDADRERRQEVGDQERGDPGGRVRALEDVDLERDEREPGAGAGAEHRQEEPPEAGLAAEQASAAGALRRTTAVHRHQR